VIESDKYVNSSVTGKIAAQKLDDFFDKHMIVRYTINDHDSNDDDDYLHNGDNDCYDDHEYHDDDDDYGL